MLFSEITLFTKTRTNTVRSLHANGSSFSSRSAPRGTRFTLSRLEKRLWCSCRRHQSFSERCTGEWPVEYRCSCCMHNSHEQYVFLVASPREGRRKQVGKIVSIKSFVVWGIRCRMLNRMEVLQMCGTTFWFHWLFWWRRRFNWWCRQMTWWETINVHCLHFMRSDMLNFNHQWWCELQNFPRSCPNLCELFVTLTNQWQWPL